MSGRVDESVRTLRALESKLQQEEDRCADSLVQAQQAQQHARIAVEQAEENEENAKKSWETARREKQQRALNGTLGASVEAFHFVARKRSEYDTAKEQTEKARKQLLERERATEAARLALAETRGRKEAVVKRRQHIEDEARKAQEAKAEEEAAERFGRGGAGRG